MFEARRARRAAARYREALDAWQRERDQQAAAVTLAQQFAGEPTSELVLRDGEALFATVTNAGLVELRRGPGRWQGGSSGVSIPVGTLGGRTIRYHVGATRGHYVAGTPHPSAVDQGTLFITNQRVVFAGASQTRECQFAKLLGYQHPGDGQTTLSVSNRQHPVTVSYGRALDGWVQLRLDLALAHYRHQVPALVERLRAELAAIEAAKPAPPPAPS